MASDPIDRSVTGIVLAGGRSSRFGTDKLAVEVHGRPLLDHAVLALAAVCDELIVAVSRDGPEPALPAGVEVPLSVAHDTLADAGPLAGLVAGLEAAHGNVAVVAGGDQPELREELLRLLIASLGTADAAVLADGPEPRSLPVALRREPAVAAARGALGSVRRSLLGVILALQPVVVPEAAWRVVDPDGAWRRDIDRPKDLQG
jgi:molybdopterin-guanine dinucleotide biosynthesis protein A